MTPKEIRVPKDDAINLDGQPVKVLVGPDPPIAFYVHKGLIRQPPAFFDNTLTSDSEQQRGSSGLSDSPDDAEYESLAGAYVLEERLKDGVFCDVIIDAMVEKYNTKATDGAYYCPGCEDIEYIYKHTRASSPARRLVVCLYALHGDKEWLAGWEKIPKDIALDFALALLDKESLPNLRQEAASTCEYHQHGSTSRCYRTLQVRGRGATKCGHFCDASFLAYLCQTPIAKGPKLLLECTRELWTMALQYIGRRN